MRPLVSANRTSPPGEGLPDCVVTAGTESGHVKESPGHDDVFHEMNLHVGIGKIAMRDERCRYAPGSEDTPDDAGTPSNSASPPPTSMTTATPQATTGSGSPRWAK
jgi:hypothetical protein